MEFVVPIGLMVVVGWIAAIVVCFLKGQRIYGVVSIAALGGGLVLNVLLVVAVVMGCSELEAPSDQNACALTIGLFAGTVVIIVTILLGFSSAVTAILGASGLATPDSWWATHRYTPAKLQAAHDRYDKSKPATTPTEPTGPALSSYVETWIKPQSEEPS